MRIYNFGSMNIDNVFRVDQFIRPGESKIARSLEAGCGGKGLNQSIACAKAGIETFHVGLIGEDGEMLRDALAANGVRVQHVRTIPGRSGCTAIQIDDAGQNCILVYSGTNNCYTEEWVDEVLDEMTGEDVILLQNEINLTATIIREAAKRGIRTAINAAPYTEALQEMPLGLVTWLIVNEIEGAGLIGLDVTGAGMEGVDFDRVMDRLREKYPETEIVLTLGGSGSLYDGRDGRIRMPARKVQAVDTTAAGDTFIGFFLSAALQGYPVQEALRAATNASALAVQVPGAADSIPEKTVAELLAE